jgi:hypothetical protein
MRIVVASCDRYSPLIPGFCHFFQKYWGNCPWSVEIFTGYPKDYLEDLPYPIVYLGADLDWAGNMILYLDEHLDDEVFLLLLDDYYLSAPPDTEFLEKVIHCVGGNDDVGYINLRPWSDDLLSDGSIYRTYQEWQHIEPEPDGRHGIKNKHCPVGIGHYDLANARHLLNLRPGVWRKAFLRSLLRAGEDGWETEIEGTERARHGKKWMLGTFSHPIPNCNVARYGIYREDPGGGTSRDWLAKELGDEHPVLVGLDRHLRGKGLR